MLIGHDRHGGYGHPDHVHAHRVAARAARLAETPRLLFGTAPREVYCRTAQLSQALSRSRPNEGPSYEQMFIPRAEITHRVRLGRYAGAKRAALRAHASQTAWRGGADRTLAVASSLPLPLFSVVLGREWFADRDYVGPLCHDIFTDLA